jgi:hypothetical protein
MLNRKREWTVRWLTGQGPCGPARSLTKVIMEPHQIAKVGRFHRLVTRRAGALEDHFLGRERPLGASRILYEIGARGADIRELRERVELGSGHLRRASVSRS